MCVLVTGVQTCALPIYMQASEWGFINQVDQWMLAIGLFSIKLYLVPLLAVGILLPISGILGLIIAAVFVMPIVLRHLAKGEYQGVLLQGRYSTAVRSEERRGGQGCGSTSRSRLL